MKPDNGRKQREPHEPSNDHVYDRYGDETRKLLSSDTAGNKTMNQGRFQLNQLIATLVPMGLLGGMDGTANKGNVVLKG